MQFSSKTLGSWKMASSTERVGVDPRVLAEGEHQGSLKAEVINSCSLEGSFIPNTSSNQASQLRVEPMWFYQKVAPRPRPGSHWGLAQN